MTGITLDLKQAVNRLKDIQETLERLQSKKDKTPEDLRSVPELLEEFRNVNAHRLDLEHDEALSEIRSALETGTDTAGGTYRSEAGSAGGDDDSPTDRWRSVQPGSTGKFKNPWDVSQIRTFGRDRDSVDTELRSRAYDAIERMPHATDKVREASTGLVERGDSRMAQLALAGSSPDYMKAFTKLVRNKGEVAVLESGEKDAYTRAMSLTDSAGGLLVPFQLDPSVILTANGSRNAVRSIARVVQVSGDTWNGISSAGVTGSWDAEAAEVSDDAPTFAAVPVPVYKGQVFVPISYEALQDEANVAQEVAQMIAFEKDRLESVAFVTGSGSGEPTGIITALTGGSSVVNSATTDTLAVADIYALDSALPARYAANASWVGHRAVYNLVRRFDTSGGANLWTQLGGGVPSQLLGRPVYEAEAMDSSVTALAANPLLVFGDFSNYLIADRVGTTITYIPFLMGSNRRPTGQAGWHALWRVGADSINDLGFRLLDVT